MSYFGSSGPAQDGGFVAGIGAGVARLSNAKNTRMRYAKGMGLLSDYPSDSILRTRAENFVESYDAYQPQLEELERLQESGTAADIVAYQEQMETFKQQYNTDRAMIVDWAESGPYVHESKVAIGGGTVLAVIAGFYLWNRYRNYGSSAKGIPRGPRKKALYAIWD